MSGISVANRAPNLNSEVKDLASNRVRFNQTLDKVENETGVNIPRLQKTNSGSGGIDNQSIENTSLALLSSNLDNRVLGPLSNALSVIESVDSSLDGTNTSDKVFGSKRELYSNLNDQNNYAGQEIKRARNNI